MYSTLHFRTLNAVFKLAYYIGAGPFIWSPSTRTVSISKSSLRRCYFHAFLVVFYTGTAGVRAFDTQIGGNIDEFSFAAGVFFVCLVSSIVYFVILGQVTYFTAYINESIRFMTDFQKEWMPGQGNERNELNGLLDRLLVFFIVISDTSLFICFSHYWAFPNAVIYPNSILPSHIRDNPGVYILIGVLVILFAFNVTQLLLLAFTIVLSFMKGMSPIIVREMKSNSSFYRSINDLRKVRNLPRVYRSLEVFHKISMELLGPAIVPVETVVTQLVLMCDFMVIRHGTKLSLIPLMMTLFWALAFQSVWIILLNLGGLFYKHSVGTISSWRHFPANNSFDVKYFARFRRSCRPLRIGHGEFYTIKRLTVLTFLRGIMRGTFRVLLTLRNTQF